MPAAVPVVIAYGIVAAVEMSKLAAFGVLVAGSLASAAISSSMARSNRNSAGLDMAGIKNNTCKTDAKLKVVYGEQKVGGNVVYLTTTGSNNNTLWMVITLAEGECQGIKQVDGVDQLFLNDTLYTEYGSLVSYTFHNGASDQTYDTDLNAIDSSWTDNMRNTCYLVISIDYDQNQFQSIPSVTVILQGRKVYDPRTDTTAYSANAALCLYDYMTASGDLYGMGIAAANMNATSVNAAANYCDTKSFTFNGIISPDDNAMDVMNKICTHFRGQVVWFGGSFYFPYADLNYESSVMTLTDEHIACDEKGRPMITVTQPGRANRPDALRIKYIDPEKNYTEDEIIVGETTGYVQDLNLDGSNTKEQSVILGTYNLERAQLDRGVSGTFRDNAIQLDPHDLITFNCTALGISNALMRVTEAKIQPGGLINLSLVYEDADLYDDTYNIKTEDVYECNFATPTDAPPNVSNVTMTETTYEERLRRRTRLVVSFDEPTDYGWFDHVEVWISFDNTNWTHAFNASDDFMIDPVEEGKLYYLRLKSVNIWGVKQADADDLKLSRTIAGHTAVPDSVAALQYTVNANSVTLYADPVDDSDVECYEIRLGTSWESATFLAALNRPNYYLYGVKPGTHTFLINTKGNNGLYGANPRSATVTLPVPHGWSVQGTTTDDYTSGTATFTNTEHTTYGGEDYLKCSHTGGTLTGTYLSDVIDLSTSAERLIYISGTVVVTGLGTAWEDVFGVGVLWSAADVSRSWSEIFQMPSGVVITISLKHGDTSPPSNTVEKMEILGTTVTARYIQVLVTITDPSETVNGMMSELTITRCT